MIYPLLTPILNLTHMDVERVDIQPSECIYITGVLGILDANGIFTPEARVGRVYRMIAGAELDAFYERPIAAGLPALRRGNFRDEDLAYWFDTYGLETSTWPQGA